MSQLCGPGLFVQYFVTPEHAPYEYKTINKVILCNDSFFVANCVAKTFLCRLVFAEYELWINRGQLVTDSFADLHEI